MSAPDNGGPAFPIPGAFDSRYDGMTLRDYFAAKAMQGLLKVNRPSDIGVMRQEWADEAYLLADAMLEARQS